MLSDLRFALRTLTKSPGFTLVAVLIAALGIGAATVMFSTVNGVVLRPVALPQPERLFALYETNLPRNQPFFSVSLPNYADWAAQTQSWEGLAALGGRAMNLSDDSGETELVYARNITANFLPVLGIPLQRGRNFTSEEDRPGGARVAIISDAFWQRRYGGREILGQAIRLDGQSYTIVGITAPGQPLPEELELAVPLATDPATERRLNHELSVYGRLKPGITVTQADAELKAIAARIVKANLPAAEQGWSTRLLPYAQEVVGDTVRRALYVLLGAVALLLLIAGANLSNLLLLRATARAHELAVRTALGASRLQVIRQIVLEGLLVSAAGGALGILLSLWAVDVMHALPLPRAGEISVDFRVLAVALAVTFLCGLGAGLGPALRASQARPQEALKGRSPRGGQRSRLRDALVIAQLALSLTLLVGAALLTRSFQRLLRVDAGFRPENTVAVSLRPAANAADFYERVTARIAALPGVAQAGTVSSLPLTSNNTSLNVFPHGESLVPANSSVQANWRLVGNAYFEAMGIPLLRGKTFAQVPADEARRSIVISAQLARQLWGDADPIGRELDPGGNGRFLTVIGVVGDVRTRQLGIAPQPTFYWSMHRFIYGPMHLVVRGDAKIDIAALLPAIRAAVKEIDPAVPVFRVRTLDELRANSLQQERLLLRLLGGFTGAALLLAGIGTYGVIAFSVQQRTTEIGIRLALGARGADIYRLVFGQGARLAAFGAVLGLAGAAVVARLLDSMLYETSVADPASYLVAAALLGIAALAAAFLPARRATKVDPLVAMRAE